ncbi:MAG: DUF1476 domain-containing protein [Alphaproteobacteria bacterium]|nr:DUF1476 domain-containing protein [Alphaproteobacteria bacterium]MBF0252130.1 DUF1476 domain-containing protein [Alphaproteobacteria bacterium]
MSDTFRSREKCFEAKHKLEEELCFKAHSHRDKLLGLWAAEKMGLDEDNAKNYARKVVMEDVEHPDDHDLAVRIHADFQDRGIDVGVDEIYAEAERLLPIARDDVKADFEALDDDHEHSV